MCSKGKKVVIKTDVELDDYIDNLQKERARKSSEWSSPPQDGRMYDMIKMNMMMDSFDQPFTEATLRYHNRNNGQTVLHVAAKKGMIEMLQQKISHKYLDARDDMGKTSLFMAAQHGFDGIVERLIQLEADPEIPTKKHKTPMYIAAKKDHLKVVILLAQSSVDINARTKNGQTPLMVAAKYGHCGIITRLILSGADESLQDCYDRTALSIAVVYGHVDVVKELLEMGASINTTDLFGRTPLCIASERHDEALISLLLKHDAKIDPAETHENEMLLSLLSKIK